MLLTLWLNALLVLTCVPGSLVPLLSRGREDRRTRAFLLTIGAVVLLVCLTRMVIHADEGEHDDHGDHDDGAAGFATRSAVLRTVAGMVLILIGGVVAYALEALSSLWARLGSLRGWHNAIDLGEYRMLLGPLLIVPALEEACYRWCLFTVAAMVGLGNWQSAMLSVPAFVLGHVVVDGLAGLRKVFLAVVACGVFVLAGLPGAVLLHVLFNLLVFLRKFADAADFSARRLM